MKYKTATLFNIFNRPSDTPYQVEGKTYTQAEMIAVHKAWQEILDVAAINDAIDEALDILDRFYPVSVREYAHNNDPDIVSACMDQLGDYRKKQDELLESRRMDLIQLALKVVENGYKQSKAGKEAQ